MNIALAFLAGLASFLSPCCLPLVPSYLFQLAGPGIAENMQSDGALALGTNKKFAMHRAPLLHSIAFVAGFGIVFIALGASASVLGYFLKSNQIILGRIGGILLVGLGLQYMGLITVPFLQREGRIQWKPIQRSYPASLLIGVVYALGWTPCIGPVLTSILILAAQAGTLSAGVGLLSVYTLGLGLPFLLLGATFSSAYPLLRRLAPYTGMIERVTGIIMILMGIVIFNNWLIYLNGWMYRIGVRGI